MITYTYELKLLRWMLIGKIKAYMKQLLHIEECKTLFAMLRPHFNPRPSSVLSKLKIPTKNTYDFMNNSKNDNLKWKTIEDLEVIEALLIIINKYYFRQDHHTPFTIEPLKSKIANGDSQFCIDILKRISDLKNLNLSHI